MIETVLGATLVVGVLMIVVIPLSRVVEEFPSVRWDMVLIDVVVGVVFTVLGAAVTAITCVAFDYMLFEPLRVILGALR